MPIWSAILTALRATAELGKLPAYDKVRRKYLVKLYQHSNRNVILYASGWLQKNGAYIPVYHASFSKQ